jgi:hypothetical protein
MKSWLLSGYFLSFIVFCSAQNNQQFNIESATITYVQSGSTYGTSVLFFDDFGFKKATKTTVRADSLNGEVLNRYHEVFINNEPLTGSNPKANTKTFNPQTSLSNSIISSSFNSEMLNNLGFIESGECTVAGKTCTKYLSNTDEICLWNGIVLKVSTHLSVVTIKLEAVRIELKPPPESVFQYEKETFNH